MQSGKMVEKEIRTLRLSLRMLDRSLHRLSHRLSAAISLNGAPKVNGRSRPRLYSKARAALVLQGRYIGYVRQLNPRQKAQVRKIREAKGVRAAIRKARDLAW